MIPLESELIAAREFVLEVLKKEGPFDGMMGFSQGAAMAASLILQHSNPAEPLVSCAIFICGTLPFMLGSEIVSFHQEYDSSRPADIALDPGEKVQHLLAEYDESWAVKSVKKKVSNSDQDGSHAQQNRAHLFHPAYSQLRFPIPTGHIYGGRKDEFCENSEALAGLGSEVHGVKVFNHDAGHIVPRGNFETDKMVGTVSWAIEKVILRC